MYLQDMTQNKGQYAGDPSHGLMGPSQFSLWLQHGPGLEDTKPPFPALTNAEKK